MWSSFKVHFRLLRNLFNGLFLRILEVSCELSKFPWKYSVLIFLFFLVFSRIFKFQPKPNRVNWLVYISLGNSDRTREKTIFCLPSTYFCFVYILLYIGYYLWSFVLQLLWLTLNWKYAKPFHLLLCSYIIARYPFRSLDFI